jgi:predicted RNA-binding Zn-ribbon protein involved in translation (DUF1610 family)
MPAVGERSAHDCPDCGQPMYWSESAPWGVDAAEPIADTSVHALEYVDAYRCANGHASQQCPLCASYDTVAWCDSHRSPHYHVICSNCGNDSVITR